MKRIVLGTRGSALALAQVDLVRNELLRQHPQLEIEVRTYVTRGDRKLDLSLLSPGDGGGKGLFTRELEHALLAGEIDAAVHSLKDLPGSMPDGLKLAAVPPRAASGDVFLTMDALPFKDLQPGHRIGTSSIRRARQAAWISPGVVAVEFRGNVQTRLRKLAESPDLRGIILAEAGLDRLGFWWRSGIMHFEQWTIYTQSLSSLMFPAIGQGIIAIQTTETSPAAAFVQCLNDPATMRATQTERHLQRLLGGDCTMPVGVRTRLDDSQIIMEGILFTPGVDLPRRAEAFGTDPEWVATSIHHQLVG